MAFVGYALYTAFSAFRAARQFQADAAIAASQARALDMQGLAAAVPALGESAQRLEGAVNGPLWSIASYLPLVGSTAGSIQDLASASVSVTTAAEVLAPELPLLDAENLRAPDGSFDLAAMRRFGAALADVQPELRSAAASVGQADPNAIGPVGEAVADAQSSLAGLPTVAQGAQTALSVAPLLLGEDAPQTSMVILQNGSEARGTGGFVGAYALMEATQGRLDVETVDTNNSLGTRIPNGFMPREFLDFWTREYTSEWNSFNLARHFPYTGELSRSGMQARGVDLDSVVAIDAAGVAALLAGTGPVTVGSDTITSENAVEFFNVGVYEKYPDPETKDAVVVALMEAVLDKVTTGAFDVGRAAPAIGALVADGRLSVWAAEDAVQAEIAPYSVAGVVPDSPGPWVTVALNNSAGNKLDAFVASEVRYTSGAMCADPQSEVVVSLTNNARAGTGYANSDAYYPGSRSGATRMWTTLYGPIGSEILSARIDGRRQFINQGEERGHPLWRWNLDLPPGKTVELTVRFTEKPSTATPTVWPQAMVIPQSVSATQAPCSQ